MHRHWLFPPTIAALLTSPIARADSPAESPGPFAVTLDGHILAMFNQTCRSTSSDTVECSSGTSWAGLHLAPRWRASDTLSLGLLGALAWRPATQGTLSSDGSSTSFNQRMWRLSAEARGYPFTPDGWQPWLALEAGVASLRDSITYTGYPGLSDSAVSQTGPVGALAIGVDFLFAPPFAGGLELRGMVIPLGKQPPDLGTSAQQATAYGTLIGASLGLNLTFQP